MQSDNATPIVDSWIDGMRFDHDTQLQQAERGRRQLTRLLTELVPDFEQWAGYRHEDPSDFLLTPEQRAEGAQVAPVRLLGLADDHLYQITAITGKHGIGFLCQRRTIEDVETSVAEFFEPGLGGAEKRQRIWSFTVSGNTAPIVLATEETLGADSPEPLEIFCRHVARATGWPVGS